MTGIDRRIELGDRLAVDALLTETVDQLEAIRGSLAELLTEDRHTLARLEAIRRHKRATGCDAVVCSNRWLKKDAGRTEPAGKEPQRSGVGRKRSQRATAGDLAGGRPCSS